AIVSSAGDLFEWAKYSAYGVPFGMPAGDCDSDGDCDSTDATTMSTWLGSDPSPAYDARLDLNLDGEIDAADQTLQSDFTGIELGRGALSDLGNHKGYAGYEFEWERGRQWNVRHRELDSTLGRWLQRDPFGYIDGTSFSQSYRSSPTQRVDPSGTDSNSISSGKNPDVGSNGLSVLRRELQAQWNSNYGEYIWRQNCCRDAFNRGTSGGSGGGWVCCTGTPVPCWEWEQWGGGPANPMIDACIRNHELAHAADLAPDACGPGTRDGDRVDWENQNTDAQARIEIERETDEIACLDGFNRTGSPTAQEQSEIRSRKALLRLDINMKRLGQLNAPRSL
ncbi:MAG: hypothetical protein IT435_02655, partial [Phycisphaerales bacterium]|nr:hypothetical protein [Phycisphaerales bacterium]